MMCLHKHLITADVLIDCESSAEQDSGGGISAASPATAASSQAARASAAGGRGKDALRHISFVQNRDDKTTASEANNNGGNGNGNGNNRLARWESWKEVLRRAEKRSAAA